MRSAREAEPALDAIEPDESNTCIYILIVADTYAYSLKKDLGLPGETERIGNPSAKNQVLHGIGA
jgi:hypothetical protein